MLKIKGSLSAAHVKRNAMIEQNLDPQSMSVKRCTVRMDSKRDKQRRGDFKNRREASAFY